MANWMRNLVGKGNPRTPTEEFTRLLTPGNIRFLRYMTDKVSDTESKALLIGTAEQMELWSTPEGRATLTDEKAVHHARNIRTVLMKASISADRRFTPGFEMLERDGFHRVAGPDPYDKWRDLQTAREMIDEVTAVINAAGTGTPGDDGIGRPRVDKPR